MTVYPLLIRLGPITISGFGLMVASAFFVAGWVMQQELLRRKLQDAYAWDIVVAAVIGGMIGAKLWYVALRQDPSALLSTSGFVWYGGFAGGALAVYLNGRRLGVPIRFTMDLAAPVLAVGHAIGRVGCFLVQDDYGVPTSLPWGLRFPQGTPPSTAFNLGLWNVPVPPDASPAEVLAVHPTQLYEVAALMLVFWVLWRARVHAHAAGWLFAAYLVLVGLERFLVEFLRAKDDRLLGDLTVAQLASVIIVIVGAVLVKAWWKPDDAEKVSRVKALRISFR